MSVPFWIQDAIFYQIFPDRFANGDPTNDPPNLRPWNLLPTRNSFQGVIYVASSRILIIY